MIRRTLTSLAFLALLAGLAMPALGQPGSTYRVAITNITPTQIIGPPIIIVHDRDFALFTLGQPASDAVAAMAEDAVLMPLLTALDGNPAIFDVATADAPLPPGQSVTFEVQARFPHYLITTAQMLVTTNDAFYAINGHELPRGPRGDRSNRFETLLAAAYDSGSEVNSESCDTVPGPPCGSMGVRDPLGAEGFVHVHPGIHGIGDLPADAWDWNNPVAQVEIVRLD